tara:strand:+ start:186 stop:467 length:282 start_codon:yes stop_codon:yes gene_type:complete
LQEDYVEHLLGTKIVVATQRSLWEDHLWLMEALAAGCLVLTDPMMLLPHGLVEHQHERLAIAAQGHRAAMAYHWSHQVLERIICEERPISLND